MWPGIEDGFPRGSSAACLSLINWPSLTGASCIAVELMARPVVVASPLPLVARHLLFDWRRARPDFVAEVSRGPHNQRSDVRLQISVADDVVVLAEIVVEE